MAKIIDYTIVDGDTLYVIAQKILGNADKAMDIALLNNLDYPFIGNRNDVPLDGINTVYPGDTILIPLDEDIEFIKDKDDPSELGSDIFLSRSTNSNMSLTVAGEFVANPYGDLQTVSGFSSLAQDLFHRLVTPKGTLVHHPEYGSSLLSIVGTKKVSDWQTIASLEVSKSLKSDPRVKDVVNIVVKEVGPTAIQIECIVIDSSSQQFPLSKIVSVGGVR